MTDTYAQMYEAIETAVREQAPDGARVVMVDGDKAGCWIEAEYADIVITAGTQNGPWGITLLARDEAQARRRNHTTYDTFDTPVDGLGGIAWWFDNREDGPADDAAPDEIATYIVGALMGAQEA